MTDTLLPCPHCGGTNINSGHIRDGRSVGCRDCGASVRAFEPDAETKARATWNRRSSPAREQVTEASALTDVEIENALEDAAKRPLAAIQAALQEPMLTPEQEAAIVEDINSGRWPYLQPSSVLRALLKRDERNTCQHEETHRGGFLWEICDQCGAKWADDEGGKPEWADPPEWVAARALLTKLQEGGR